MPLDNRFIGREDKRLPVMMEVKLVPAVGASDRRAKAMIDNVSEHGARIFASTPWGLGEQVEVTPAGGEAPLKAEVVYCQKQGSEKFVVGLKFRRCPALWSILERVQRLVR